MNDEVFVVMQQNPHDGGEVKRVYTELNEAIWYAESIGGIGYEYGIVYRATINGTDDAIEEEALCDRVDE